MKRTIMRTASFLAIIIIAAGLVVPCPLPAQQQGNTGNVVEQSLEEAFIGANPEKVQAAREKATATVPPAPKLTDGERLGRLMEDPRVTKITGINVIKGAGPRPFVIAAYNTRTPVVSKPSKVAWEKISGVVTIGEPPEIIVSSPGSVFEVNGSSYILTETESGMLLTFVANSKKATIMIGVMEGSFITTDGYVCRVKRYEEK